MLMCFSPLRDRATESVPRNVYEELVLRCADGRRGPWLQLGREAMELYLNEAMEGRFSPSYKVVRSMLTVRTHQHSSESLALEAGGGEGGKQGVGVAISVWCCLAVS